MSNRNALRTGGIIAATALAGIILAAPAQARIDPAGGGFGPAQAPVVSQPVPAPDPGPTVDDDAGEYLQLGAGLLAGLAIAGAAAAVVSRRQHQDPHPV